MMQNSSQCEIEHLFPGVVEGCPGAREGGDVLAEPPGHSDGDVEGVAHGEVLELKLLHLPYSFFHLVSCGDYGKNRQKFHGMMYKNNNE